MAITSGAGPHFAWLNVNGSTFPIEHGSVEQQKTKRSSTFSATIPLSYPGAEATLATLGDNAATITVSSRGIDGLLFTGEVDETRFDYIGRIIQVTGRDKAARLHEKKTSEKWINKKGHEIVKDLAGRVGLGVEVDDSALRAGKLLQQDHVRLSDNVSYAYVIHKLAEFDGARWWVDVGGMLHYAMSGSQAGTYSLNYVPPLDGPMVADFMRLVICRNVQAGKNIKVTVKSWHPKDKQVYTGEFYNNGNGGTLNYDYHIPNLKQDHVDKYAKSRANEIGRHELRLEANVVGDPTINVAMGLQLNGTGYWDQNYEMDAISHEIGMSGHRTRIVARSRKTGSSFSSGTNTGTAPQTTSSGEFYSDASPAGQLSLGKAPL